MISSLREDGENYPKSRTYLGLGILALGLVALPTLALEPSWPLMESEKPKRALAQESSWPLMESEKPKRSKKTAKKKEERALGLEGYGEMHFNQPSGAGSGQIDLHRFIIELDVDLGPKTRIKSELEIEHSKDLEMEKAYIEQSLSNTLRIKAGLLLVPVGWINLHHNPPTFHGVERPLVDTVILPTTWREGGLALVWDFREDVQVEAGIYSGLDASSFEEDSGIRQGRGGAAQTPADDPAAALRLDISPDPEWTFGLAGYWGEADRQQADLSGVAVGLGAAHLFYEKAGLGIRGEAAFIHIREALKVAVKTGQKIPENLFGYYLELSYNILHTLETEHELWPFVRVEDVDLQSKMPLGISFDPALRKQIITAGLSYRPTPGAVFKADYQREESRVQGSKVEETLNLGVGWAF